MTSKKRREIIDYVLMADDIGGGLWAGRDFEKAAAVLSKLLEHTRGHPEGKVLQTKILVEFKFAVSPQGIVKMLPNPSSVLALDGINLNRIRHCEYCHARYYAPRGDSRACSEAHTSTLRQRDYRKQKGTKKK